MLTSTQLHNIHNTYVNYSISYACFFSFLCVFIIRDLLWHKHWLVGTSECISVSASPVHSDHVVCFLLAAMIFFVFSFFNCKFGPHFLSLTIDIFLPIDNLFRGGQIIFLLFFPMFQIGFFTLHVKTLLDVCPCRFTCGGSPTYRQHGPRAI